MALETAEQMKGKPAGDADFFESLQEKLETDASAFGEITLEDNTQNRTAASIRYVLGTFYHSGRRKESRETARVSLRHNVGVGVNYRA